MDLKQFRQQLSREEREKVLEDALKTQNPVLIMLAINLGAHSLNGEIQLLEALQGAICLKNIASEVFEILLDYFKKNSPNDFNKCLVLLADYTVDTERVDCMEVMRQYGLDLAYVNTRYCSKTMRKYFEEHGIKVSNF